MRERTPLGSVPPPYDDVVKSVPPMGFARAGRSEAATRLAAPIARMARRDADGLKPTGCLMTKSFYGDHHSMVIAIAASSETYYVRGMPRRTDARARAIATAER